MWFTGRTDSDVSIIHKSDGGRCRISERRKDFLFLLAKREEKEKRSAVFKTSASFLSLDAGCGSAACTRLLAAPPAKDRITQTRGGNRRSEALYSRLSLRERMWLVMKKKTARKRASTAMVSSMATCMAQSLDMGKIQCAAEFAAMPKMI